MAAKGKDAPNFDVQIKQLRQKKKAGVGFAMQIAKDGIIFKTDIKKTDSRIKKIWNDAKKDGGTPKGAKGIAVLAGKNLILKCDNLDKVPGSLIKAAKKAFSDAGSPFLVKLEPLHEDELEADDEAEEGAEDAGAASGGAEEAEAPDEQTVEAVEEAADEAVAAQVEEAAAEGEDPTEALRGVLQQEFDDLAGDLEQARQSSNAGAAKKVGALSEMFETQLAGDVKKAASVMTLLKTTVQDALAAGVAGAAAGGAGGAGGDRRAQMEELERGVDALLAEFA